MSIGNYVWSRVHSTRRQFSNPDYQFWSLAVRDQDLISSHVGVTLKSKHGLPSRISVSDLQDALGDRTSTLYRLLTPIFSSIRGTSQYWYQVRTQLFAMVRMLGTPTWFVTITMNETCWTDLLCVLLAQDTRAYNFNQGDDELLDEVITSVNKADIRTSPNNSAIF